MTTTRSRSETVQERLKMLANAFNNAFESHRRFPLDASERLARGERVSVYSGVPEEWVAALHIEVARESDEGDTTLIHTLELTSKHLPPRMRERLQASATLFEESLRRDGVMPVHGKP